MLSEGSHSVQTRPEPRAMAQVQQTPSTVSSRWKWVLYVAAGVAIVLAAKYFHVQDLLKAALDWIGKLGPWGPVIFVALYVVATVLFIPGSVLTLGAGAVFDEGWKIVLLTRLSPIFPFTLLNYAFGLTRVKLSHYVLASWLGMIPGTVMYVYLGSLVSVGAGHRQRTTGEWVLYGVGLLATVTVTVFVTRLARNALAKKIGSNKTEQNGKEI